MEIMDVLKQIESGKITIKCISEDPDFYAGNHEYKASNGWTITVYIDAGQFDYIDSIGDENGNEIICPQSLFDYRPNQKIEREIYKIGLDKK